jgi:hypothetical protein
MASSLVCCLLDRLKQCIRKRSSQEEAWLSHEFLPPSVSSPGRVCAAEPPIVRAVQVFLRPFPESSGRFERACTGGAREVSSVAWACGVPCSPAKETPPPTPSTSSGSSSSMDEGACCREDAEPPPSSEGAVQAFSDAVDSEEKTRDAFEGE